MKQEPIVMEKYFSPGFKYKPAVLEGSQTLKFWRGDPEEQAWEGVHLAGSSKGDVAIVRNINPYYLEYWASLMDNPRIINLTDTDPGEYLTKVILDNPETIELIKQAMNPVSKLMVFFPTDLELQLANRLGIPLHGKPEISKLYGTKSGIRNLADEASIAMAPGFICSTLNEVKEALGVLEKKFDEVVIKHDHSASGYFSKRLPSKQIGDLKVHLKEIVGKDFVDGEEIIVVEGWLKSKVSLCAQIEILEAEEPVICAGWQQIIDKDGISYMGGGPLMLSKKAFDSFYGQVQKLAKILKQKGAIGSFGPDFLVTSEDETRIEPDTSVLIELNARVPYTAFPLEIIKQIKGKIGNGFLAKHMKVHKKTTFKQLEEILKKGNLLITKKDTQAKGVVPYNSGLLKWGMFDIVAMADSWEETLRIIQKMDDLFRT